MGFKKIFTKGASVAFASKSSQHSKKASSFAKQAISSFQRAKSKKDNEKIDCLIEGMNKLANSIIEISDSVPPIAQMTAVNTLFGENLERLLEEKMLQKNR